MGWGLRLAFGAVSSRPSVGLTLVRQLLLYASQGSYRYIPARMWHSDTTFFRGVLELFMAADLIDFVPAVFPQFVDQLPGCSSPASHPCKIIMHTFYTPSGSLPWKLPLGQVQSESGLVVSTPANTPLLDLWHSIEFDCKRPEG